MILYKYVSFTAAQSIINHNAIGFSQPRYFNDPFDVPRLPREDRGRYDQAAIIRQLDRMGLDRAWGEYTGILSLTRTPNNPLMWAHYADSHRGAVVGIDAVRAGFTTEHNNLIPAQYGSVVYKSGWSSEPFISDPGEGLGPGFTHEFSSRHYEQLQRLFLQKPICWAYEEEVRVVKCLKALFDGPNGNPSGHFTLDGPPGRPRHNLQLASGSIVELYLGFNADHDASDELFRQATCLHPSLRVYEPILKYADHSIGFQPYVTMEQAAAEAG